MADINVDVSLPNSINVNVTSPTQQISSNVTIPATLVTDTTSPTQSLSANVFVTGPQGPSGEQGPQGPQGPSGIPNTGELDLRYYSINNPSGFITGVDLSNYITKTNGQFTDRPTVNGTGVLLSGEATNLPNTIVYTTGNQTISGNKTFDNNLTINSSGTGFFENVKISNLSELVISGAKITVSGNSGVYLYTPLYISGNPVLTGIQDSSWASQTELNLLSGDSVLISGDQNISGIKNFYSRPTVNGTGVLLNGDVAALPNTLVYTTGNQTIEGEKTFTGLIVTGTGISFILKSINDANSVYFNPNIQGGAGLLGINWISTRGILSQGDYDLNFYYGGGGTRSVNFNSSNISTALLDSNGNFGIGSGISSVPSKFYVSGNTLLIGDLNVTGNILLSGNSVLTGEAVNLPTTIVYTTGDQIISGNKTFKENILVEGTGIFNSVDLSNISEFSFSGTNIILIDSSISISGQRPTVNGTGVLLSGEAAGGGGVLEKRHDFVTGSPYDYSYCGTAPENSLESSSVWDITRLSIDSAGLVAFNQSVTNYSWTGRYLAPYA